MSDSPSLHIEKLTFSWTTRVSIISLIISVQVLISQMTLMRWVCLKVSQHHSQFLFRATSILLLFTSAFLSSFHSAPERNQMVIDIAESLCSDCINEWISLDFSFDGNQRLEVQARFTSPFSVIVCLALCLCTEGYWKNNCRDGWEQMKPCDSRKCCLWGELGLTIQARQKLSFVHLKKHSQCSSFALRLHRWCRHVCLWESNQWR